MFYVYTAGQQGAQIKIFYNRTFVNAFLSRQGLNTCFLLLLLLQQTQDLRNAKCNVKNCNNFCQRMSLPLEVAF